jgi:hypothetical protein
MKNTHAPVTKVVEVPKDKVSEAGVIEIGLT